MPTVSENNKRIAKNTLFLYFRQLLVMAVSLYTVRVVLAELGAEDYGIYNVVGGGKSSVSCPLKPSDSAPLKHSTMPP